MFDAIVIGSGMSGGIAAKELCERGLKTLVIERGKKIEHGTDYNDWMQPWDLPKGDRLNEDERARDYPIQSNCYALSESTKHLWVKDSEHPYSMDPANPFMWLRGNHLGGRSIMWGRQSYRMSEMDLLSNSRDGVGSEWPVTYDELAPWYDRVEEFIGVSGARDELPQLPNGPNLLPPFEMTDAEKLFKAQVESKFPGRHVINGRAANLTVAKPHHIDLGRGPCQDRNLCHRGCSFGAYHSSLSSSLPAAERTGNLTIVTDAIAHSIIHDPKTNRVTGVRVVDQNTKEARTYEASVIFLCASTIGTAQVLLNSRSAAAPSGLANSSDMVGRNLMDHVFGAMVMADMPGPETYYSGRRPNSVLIPRYRNLDGKDPIKRGYCFGTWIFRENWQSLANKGPGIGSALKERVREPGGWKLRMFGVAEMLPNPENRVTLHGTKVDTWGIPQVHITCAHSENDKQLVKMAARDAREMVEAAGGKVTQFGDEPLPAGLAIHEMGTARMGKDPRNSVLNGHNQTHDVPNLYITDGSAMASGACQNPSLTYMAMSARAAHHAADLMQAGQL